MTKLNKSDQPEPADYWEVMGSNVSLAHENGRLRARIEKLEAEVKAERERCARIADTERVRAEVDADAISPARTSLRLLFNTKAMMAQNIAAAIREGE